MEPSTDQTNWLFPRLWAIFLCILIAATFRLWCVQDEVPPIAMFAFAKQLPSLVGWLPLLTILLGSVLVITNPVRFRPAWWLISVGLTFAFALNQHRLQPWAYQSAIYAVVFATLRPMSARRLLIPLAASVYIYSAAGKLDYQFAHTVGQDFLSTILAPLGVLDSMTETIRVKLALVFPLIELTAGVLLLPVRTRRYAAYVLIAMHASLLLILGPLGQNHSNGVLVWNIALAVQAYYLFIAPELSDGRSHQIRYRELFRVSRGKPRRIASRFFAFSLVLFAIAAPLTERMGLWDHWTSWSLYSPHSSRVEVEIHQSQTDVLAESARKQLLPDNDDDGWHRLALDQWSLHSLAVPIYPQARYQLALACEVAQQSEVDPRAIRCRFRGVSDRTTGVREEQLMFGMRDMRRALQDYWLVSVVDPTGGS